MHRLFGTSRAAGPKPTLDEAQAKVETRLAAIDKKIHNLNLELSRVSQLINASPLPSTKAVYRKKAAGILQQRKQFEQTREQLMQQTMNMDQAVLMKANLENTMITIDAMKTTTKELERQYGKVRIEEIEKLQDKMEDMRDMGEEIQQAMAWQSGYDVPADLDEAELDAELSILETTIQLEKESASQVEESKAREGGLPSIPDYLLDVPVPPTQKEETPEQAGPVKEAAR